MKWQKERDELIAQTKAFVQSVTGRTPQTVLSPIFNKPAPIENPFVVPAPASPPPLPTEQVVATKSTETRLTETRLTEARPAGATPTEATPIEQDLSPVKTPTPSDVRKEIQTRVAAFQAHQHRFHRERDAYFNSVLTKARLAIKDGPPSS